MNIEHQEICKAGAALIDAELRKPACDRVTVYAVHSTPDRGGYIILDRPLPTDAPDGFTVVHPDANNGDWRAVPYSAIFTRLMESTKRLPILPYA